MPNSRVIERDTTPPAPISRRLNAQRLVLLAWPRAILLQLAHPLVAAGVYDHSGFRASRWAAVKRLEHTVRAMLALTFGDESAREGALETIRAIHRRVHGQLRDDVGPFAAGTPYSAEDPHLVLWVHATLAESVLILHELLHAPLSGAERDAYCVETASIAMALKATPDSVPRTWKDLRGYLEAEQASGRIAVGAQAREMARSILYPPFRTLAAPAASVNRILTLGTLPDAVRRQYGCDWTPASERSFARAVSAVRLMRHVLPRSLATWRAARRQPARL